MTLRFDWSADHTGIELRLVGPTGPIPPDSWAVAVPDALLPGVDLVQRLIGSDAAVAGDDCVLIEHRAISELSRREADAIGLPGIAPAVAHVRMRGVIARPDCAIELEWRRSTGQSIVGAKRIGAMLRIGEAFWRLPDILYLLAEAADRLNRAGGDEAERYAALAELQEVLPAAEADGDAIGEGLIGGMTIGVADAFSLDLQGEGQDVRLVPILHRAGAADDDPLLDPDAQRAFGEKQFNQFGTAKPVYALGGRRYVVLTPTLRQCLDVVRRTQSGTATAKRAMMAAPRAVLRQALGDSVEEAVIETAFRDTAAYSERVLGLGLWQKRVLPWLDIAGTDWFEEGGERQPAATAKQTGGIVVGDRRIPLDPAAADELRARVERAIGAGERTVPLETEAGTIDVPADHDTLASLQRLETARAKVAARRPGDTPPVEVLLIRPNEGEVDLEGAFAPRVAPASKQPSCLDTSLKAHQEEGLAWLCGAYAMGRPGVLLADDMGLGKTLQGLAFLAWLREGMDAGTIPRAPVAIVAPTGLLANWKAEELRHLTRPGLGVCLDAFGKGLAALKRPTEDGRPRLDTAALERADWVVTTYETLRDHDRDFGSVRFAAMLFDEAQKIKTPGVRVTDAAKAMHADFRIALTGTPVENRLADLWCITDAIHPALLGDLKTFSAEYERAADPERLKRLKASLDAWHGGRPPALLRRLKSEQLPDLPLPQEVAIEGEMPPVQRDAYQSALGEARAARGNPGAALKGLQQLRRISLHPDTDMEASDDAFVAASARLNSTMAILDRIATADERALIFLDDLALQGRLAGIVQRRYRLTRPPMIINGAVPGAARQARVDRFQADTAGFDVMILSSRAGGVGLTLTAANHAIHLSRWWNPAVEDQCTGRVLRIGQTRPVFIHLPLAVLDQNRPCFDRNLDALLRRKRELFQQAFMPPEVTDIEREELFRTTIGE